MSQVTISKNTKRSLLRLIAGGERIPDWYLPFLGSDINFAEAAVREAIESENSHFVLQVQEFIGQEETEKSSVSVARKSQKKKRRKPHNQTKKAKRPANPRVKAVYDAIKHIPLRRSPNYSPTGTSFKEFMKTKGHPMDTHPNSTWHIHFVQGGAPSLGRRS